MIKSNKMNVLSSNENFKTNDSHQSANHGNSKIHVPFIKSSSCSSPLSSPKILESITCDQEYQYTLYPSTIPGVLHAQNYGALDWSQNGLIAYGCQNRIVVVDTKPSLSFRQTLHRHKQTVCFVKWSPLTNHLCLCSVDIIGTIIVWDIIESAPLTVILSTNENRAVSVIHWIHMDPIILNVKSKSSKINCWDLNQCKNNKLTTINDQQNGVTTTTNENVSSCLATNLFLLAFYQHNNTIIIYDADLGEPVTRWQIDYLISHLLVNPFFKFNHSCDSSVQNLLFGFKSSAKDQDRIYLGMARLDEHNILLNDHSTTSKEPQNINLQFSTYVLLKENNKNGHFDLIQCLDKNKLSKHLISINDSSFTNTQTNDSIGTVGNSISSQINENQLIQIEFHKSVRNQVFLVFPRDIYLVDLPLETIITTIPIERNFSRLIKIFSCALRNAFYALHENGSVSFRLYQKKVIQDNLTGNNNSMENDSMLNDQSFLNIGYVNLCHSEPIRLTKQNKIYGYSISPFDETKVAFLLKTGKIIFKSLIYRKSSTQNDQDQILSCLNDLIKPQDYKLGAFLLNNENNDDLNIQDEDQDKSLDSVLYKIIVTHYISGLNSIPTVIRMSPPLTVQNIHQHKPLLAVGDTLGIVQIWLLNNNTASLHREFCAHSYAIAGIEWADLTSLITFSYPTINSPAHNYTKHPLSALQNFTSSGNSPGKVTNELIHIDTDTGKLTPFRTNHITDSSPIETIRVSHLKQYLIILFKRDDPFEIWDVRTLTLLKVMSKSIGFVTSVEWSPLYNRKQVAKNAELSDSDTGPSKSSSSSFHQLSVKENFIVTSRELYHFSIEGNIVRELARIPPDVEGGHVTVTSIAWKCDQVLFGDASGTLNLWDLKRKGSRTEATYRTCIKKVRFGPGRGNMKCLILYADFGVDIWDINEFRLCSQLKFPRDINFKIIDVDWASCDLLILSTAEGFIFVTNHKLKTYSSPLNIERLSMSKSFWLNNDGVDEKTFYQSLQDLNVNFLTLEMRKRLIRKFIFEIPYKRNPIIDDDNREGPTPESESDTLIVDLKKYINKQILLAKLFSNQNDYDFWLLVSSILLGEELDSRLDLFLDNNHFRHLLQEKLMLLDHNRRTYFHACQVYRLNLNLKNFQRAVQVLLESESLIHSNRTKHDIDIDSSVDVGGTTFYVDALKACLIAALQTNGPKTNANIIKDQIGMNKSAMNDDISIDNSLTDNDESSINQPTDNSDSNNSSNLILNETKVAPVVKLVSTSLIANGHITEGVELLTVISKTSDACRYLQSSDRWLDSIWLAKSSLDGNECTEIMRRWCEYLISSKRFFDQQTALKVYLSRRQFSRVLRALNQFSELKSFPLAVICIGAQLIDCDANMDCLEDIFHKTVEYFYIQNACEHEDQNVLLEKIKHQQTDSNLSDDLTILQKCWNLFFQQRKQSDC